MVRVKKGCKRNQCRILTQKTDRQKKFVMKYVYTLPIVSNMDQIAWRREAWKEEVLDDLP